MFSLINKASENNEFERLEIELVDIALLERSDGSVEIRPDYDQEIKGKEIIVYTSGYGGLFKPGLPVGKIIANDLNKDNQVNFFSDFRQLDYVKIVSYEIGSGN